MGLSFWQTGKGVVGRAQNGKELKRGARGWRSGWAPRLAEPEPNAAIQRRRGSRISFRVECTKEKRDRDRDHSRLAEARRHGDAERRGEWASERGAQRIFLI